MQTNNGKKGGLLKGKPHYDKNGKPMGGIKAVVTDSGQQVELEGGEVIINKEASKKHWKELSRINQSAGGGVPILPPDEDDGGDEFADGGRTIEFNPNHLPNRWVYQYAKNIKEKYPKVWDMGGNIFGNEAFKNLERALKRGYWTDNEKWMYIKWQSFNARHSGDIRIAGIIANLKWLNKVDKGWDYMKQLIEAEIDKKYGDSKMGKGGKTNLLSERGTFISKDKKTKLDYKKVGSNYEFSVYEGETNPVENYTRTQFKKRNGNNGVMSYQQFINFIYDEGFIDDKKMAKGGKLIKRADGSYSRHGLWDSIRENAGSGRKPTKEMLKQEEKIKKQMGGGGGLYDDDKQFDMVVVSKQAPKDGGKQFEDRYTVYARNINEAREKALKQWQDNFGAMSDLSIVRIVAQSSSSSMKRWGHGGELAKGINVEKEHSKTAEKLYNRKITPQQSYREIAKDHLKEDSHYYTKLNKFESKMADGGTVGLPATDPSTWEEEYNVGDEVRWREDVGNGMDLKIYTITKKEINKSLIKEHNPKGIFYELATFSNNGSIENKVLNIVGAEIELAIDTLLQLSSTRKFSGTLGKNLGVISDIIREGGEFGTVVDKDSNGHALYKYFTIPKSDRLGWGVNVKALRGRTDTVDVPYPLSWVREYIFQGIWFKKVDDAPKGKTEIKEAKKELAQPTIEQSSYKKMAQPQEQVIEYNYEAGLKLFIEETFVKSEETSLNNQKFDILRQFEMMIKK